MILPNGDHWNSQNGNVVHLDGAHMAQKSTVPAHPFICFKRPNAEAVAQKTKIKRKSLQANKDEASEQRKE